MTTDAQQPADLRKFLVEVSHRLYFLQGIAEGRAMDEFLRKIHRDGWLEDAKESSRLSAQAQRLLAELDAGPRRPTMYAATTTSSCGCRTLRQRDGKHWRSE